MNIRMFVLAAVTASSLVAMEKPAPKRKLDAQDPQEITSEAKKSRNLFDSLLPAEKSSSDRPVLYSSLLPAEIKDMIAAQLKNATDYNDALQIALGLLTTQSVNDTAEGVLEIAILLQKRFEISIIVTLYQLAKMKASERVKLAIEETVRRFRKGYKDVHTSFSNSTNDKSLTSFFLFLEKESNKSIDPRAVFSYIAMFMNESNLKFPVNSVSNPALRNQALAMAKLILYNCFLDSSFYKVFAEYAFETMDQDCIDIALNKAKVLNKKNTLLTFKAGNIVVPGTLLDMAYIFGSKIIFGSPQYKIFVQTVRNLIMNGYKSAAELPPQAAPAPAQ